MSTILMILGGIFLAIVFIVIVFLLLLFAFGRYLLNKFNKHKDGVNFNTETFADEVFSDFPVIGNFLKKLFTPIESGRKYCNSELPIILLDWNSRELVRRSTRDYLDALEPGEPEKSFKSHLRNLGKLKDVTLKPGELSFNFIERTFQGAFEATFERGLAQIQIQLAKEENKWLINNFGVHYLFQLVERQD